MQKNHRVLRFRRPSSRRRSGVAAFWFVLAMPVFFTGMVLVIDMAFVWLCRAEAQDAASAGALAGVKIPWNEPGSGCDRAGCRPRINEFLASNSVGRTSISLPEFAGSPVSSSRVVCTGGQILLGDVRFQSSGPVFRRTPHNVGEQVRNRGCHVNLTLQVDSLCMGIKGAYTVKVSATAVHEDGQMRLLRVGSVTD